jgi:hypothetical protein
LEARIFEIGVNPHSGIEVNACGSSRVTFDELSIDVTSEAPVT